MCDDKYIFIIFDTHQRIITAVSSDKSNAKRMLKATSKQDKDFFREHHKILRIPKDLSIHFLSDDIEHGYKLIKLD